MNNAIYITGHKNPDTDSIVSALSYGYLKQTLGENAVGVRIGPINPETQFVLDYFHQDPPPLVYDIRTRIRDIVFDDAVTIPPDGMLYNAIKIMSENKKKVIAITTPDNMLLGLATISDITNTIVDDSDKHHSLIARTPLENYAHILKGTLANKPEKTHLSGEIFIASTLVMDEDADQYKDRVVITSGRTKTQLKAISSGAGLVIGTRMSQPAPEVIKAAKKANVGYITTEYDMYKTSQLINQAVPVSLIMTSTLVHFQFDDYVEDVKVAINRSRFRSYPVLDQKGHLVGLISRYHLFKHHARQLILVDHNELEQSIAGAGQADILEIIDHHRIGGIRTTAPAVFRNELVGCCNTIIAGLYAENNVPIPPAIAGMMVGAIISDTLFFNSITCTQKDIDTAKELAKIAGLDLKTFANSVLSVSASITGKSIREIVYNDLKVFEIDKYRAAIGQINIMNVGSIQRISTDVKNYLVDLGQSNNFGICIMIFSIVDGSGSYLIYTGPDAFLVDLAFHEAGEMKDGFLFLKGVLSRKKQIVPLLSDAARTFNGAGN